MEIPLILIEYLNIDLIFNVVPVLADWNWFFFLKYLSIEALLKSILEATSAN